MNVPEVADAQPPDAHAAELSPVGADGAVVSTMNGIHDDHACA